MPVAAIAALAPVVIGGIQALSASGKAKDQQAKSDALFKQRKPYKTPTEVLDIFNQAQYNAQSGYDPTTLNYLTSQTQNSTNSALDTAKLLGGDPNSFASILDQNFQNIFKIGSENNLLKMKKFDSLINATQLIAQNKDAEFASQDNLLKDQLQTSAQRTQVARANEQSGINLALNGLSALGSSTLFNESVPGYTSQYSRSQVRRLEAVQPTSVNPVSQPRVDTNFNIQPR